MFGRQLEVFTEPNSQLSLFESVGFMGKTIANCVTPPSLEQTEA
ncbi:hypothetical protein ACVWW6_000107 [Bradyrhizobium sp. USDA 3311]